MRMRVFVRAIGDDRIDLCGIPENNQIGEQRQPSGNRGQLFAGSAMRATDLAVMDRALQPVHGLALSQQRMDGPPEFGVGKVVGEVDRAQQLADCLAGLMDGRASSGDPKSLDRLGSGTPTMPDRGRYVQEAIIALGDCPGRHTRAGNWRKDFGHRKAAWEIELALTQIGQARAQIKTDRLGDSHRKMGEPVRVDRDAFDFRTVQCTFDCRTSLAVVHQDWAIVEDRPLIEHVGLGPDRRRAAAGIVAGGPQAPACLDAHHVG